MQISFPNGFVATLREMDKRIMEDRFPGLRAEDLVMVGVAHPRGTDRKTGRVSEVVGYYPRTNLGDVLTAIKGFPEIVSLREMVETIQVLNRFHI